jgi:hypothetical protein
MKTIDDIQNEITAICYQYGFTLADTLALALSAYISQQIMDARQDVFDMIIDHLDKKGVQ